MRTYGEVVVWLHAILTSVLDKIEWVASRWQSFTEQNALDFSSEWMDGQTLRPSVVQVAAKSPYTR